MANSKQRLFAAFMNGAVALLVVAGCAPPARAEVHKSKANFCKNLFNPTLNPSGKIFASQGAQMYCFGPELNFGAPRPRIPAYTPGGKNVDAANPSEDISPNGTQAYGQSETSIAAIDQYVVEAWNDATGFFAPCPSPNYKEESTGFGFSNNGGASFTDLGGLPNNNCATTKYAGDPSVEAWGYQGQDYFYISSLLSTQAGDLEVAVTACQVVGFGSSAMLGCGQPTIVATSPGGPGAFSFLDKDFATIDPLRGRLYISYTDFGAGDSIALAVCDLTSNPMQPVCSNGGSNGPIYLVVAPPDPNGCENEGAYAAVDVTTGDVYVAYEHNWPSAFAFGPCQSDPTKEVVTRIPYSCLTLPGPSPCTGPLTKTSVFITSMSGAFIPGYNRFPMNDFPRIAVSPVHGTVSIVWNDARFKPSGDILLQSWSTGTSFPSPIQFGPVVVDNASTAGSGWQFLPAMRNTDDDGNLYISWYGRAVPNTAITNVFEAVGVSPMMTHTPANIQVTDVASDWNAVSSDIVPNFGDYTDNYVVALGRPPFTGGVNFIAWSDGRLGLPQPFEAHIVH